MKGIYGSPLLSASVCLATPNCVSGLGRSDPILHAFPFHFHLITSHHITSHFLLLLNSTLRLFLPRQEGEEEEQ
ncbi:hypothetical protein VNO77_08905 [Canavalia gladiata]|uniref:Uncharacterized protein n=1 Tax=Canavalia gladiata TaxID=3824 RepID=A0AAN9MAD4_CANGL